MQPLRRAPALLAALALAGCQSGQGTPESTPTPPAAPRPVAARDTPSPRPAAPPVAASQSQVVLGYLKAPGDDTKCQWMRHPLPGEPSTVFSFNAACDRSMVSWSPDGKQGVVFTWPSGEGEVARAWRVDVGAKSGQPLDLKSLPGGTGTGGPNKPYVSRIGFDAQARPVALIVLTNPRAAKGVLTFEGERFTAPRGPGVPGLALAYRLEDGAWKRAEAKPSRFEASGAPGLTALDVEKTLTPVWTASIPASPQGRKAPADMAKALDSVAQDSASEGWWMELPASDGTLYYRASEAGSETVMGQPLFWSQGGKRVALKDVAEPDAYLGFQVHRGLLLVTAYGGYAAAHVWNPAKPERIASVPEVYAPAFWPAP
jgi:hypothetical protein